MNGVIFMHTLRRNFRTMIIWGVVMAFTVLLTLSLRLESTTLQQYADIIEAMPPFMLSMLGTSDVQFILTPEGALNAFFFSWIVVAFVAYGVNAGLNITISEEDRGIMDVVLANPVPRWRVVVEKFLAYTVLIIGILTITFVGIVVSSMTLTAFQLNVQRALENTINLLPPTLFAMALTTLVGTVVRSRATASGVAILIVFASYFINFLRTSLGDVGGSIGALSFFSYYDSEAVALSGLVWGNIALLVVLAAAMVALSVAAFQRRDLNI